MVTPTPLTGSEDLPPWRLYGSAADAQRHIAWPDSTTAFCGHGLHGLDDVGPAIDSAVGRYAFLDALFQTYCKLCAATMLDLVERLDLYDALERRF